MSPTALRAADSANLERRDTLCRGRWYDDDYDCRRGNWHWWGRWVLTGVIIVLFLIFLAILLRNSRRRRRTGQQPVYGTGWMGKWGGGYNNQQPQQGYAMPPPQYSQQAPPVGAQYTGQTYNSNEGYYGTHNTGTYNNDIPLQSPPTAYYPNNNRTTGGEDYAPPAGPPPAKH